jgi:hypothetical protein
MYSVLPSAEIFLEFQNFLPFQCKHALIDQTEYVRSELMQNYKIPIFSPKGSFRFRQPFFLKHSSVLAALGLLVVRSRPPQYVGVILKKITTTSGLNFYAQMIT